jgi:hypothetical protein
VAGVLHGVHHTLKADVLLVMICTLETDVWHDVFNIVKFDKKVCYILNTQKCSKICYDATIMLHYTPLCLTQWCILQSKVKCCYLSSASNFLFESANANNRFYA